MPLVHHFRYSSEFPVRVPSSRHSPKSKRIKTHDILKLNIKLKLSLPTSLESERRKAMMLIHSAEKELRNFKSKYFRNYKNTFTMETEDFIRYVHEKTGKRAKANDCKEFGEFLSRCRTTVALLHRDELEKMDAVLSRSCAFDEMLTKCQDNLLTAFNDHIDTFCLSFASEAHEVEINCVQEYENNIVKWREAVNDGLTKLEEIERNIKLNCGESFEDYKKNYDNILYGMKTALNMVPRIANPMKDWITADEAYSRKLHDEVNQLMHENLEITKDIRTHQLRAGDALHNMRRKTYSTKNINKKLNQTIEERRYLRKRELALVERQNNLETTIKKKKKREGNLYEDLYFERSYSPTQSKILLSEISTVHDQLSKLEKKLDFTKDNLAKSKSERKTVQKEIHRLQKLYENNLKSEEHVTKNAEIRERDVQKSGENSKGLKAKLDCVKRIRSIKLHPSTLRKLYDEGYSPGRKFDMTDGFGDACKIAAAGIGHKWPILYQHLPFNPPRDSFTRNHDIEAFDISGQKRDLTSKDVTLKSFAKWKRLSTDANTRTLVDTLRYIEKGKLARKIEKHISSVS